MKQEFLKENITKKVKEPTEEQREVEVLKAFKEQIADELQEELHMITEGKGILRGRGTINRDTLYDPKHDSFFVDCNGKLGTATLGDMIADISLGCEYTVSLDTTPAPIAKQYVLARAKTRMNQLYNRQIALQEKEISEKKGKLTRAGYFEEALKDLDAREQGTEIHAGKQFEQDAIHLLKQVQFDIPELGIEVEEVNVVQDMDEKIDFIVKAHEHHRGVQVEEDNKTLGDETVFGIQFTLKWKEEDLKIKQNKIDKALKKGIHTQVDDVLLITVPTACSDIKKAHEQWHREGCPPGGPVKLYSEQVRMEILEKIVDRVGERNVIKTHRERLEKYFVEKK
ncbi:MAG: hypothetical protein WC099_01815 [Candidatus Paceibacterota bacterium]